MACLAVAITAVHTGTEAEEVVVPLDDFLGVYTLNEYTYLPIDAGVSLSRVTGARIEWAGEATAGYAWLGGVECEPGSWDIFPLRFWAYLRENDEPRATTQSDFAGHSTYPEPEPFDTVSDFSLWWNETWDFLLDGRCELRIDTEWFPISFCSVIVQTEGVGVLSSAQLVIEGMRHGDFDGDGDVDMGDHDQLTSCFTGSDVGAVPPLCEPGDFDEDEDIDCVDCSAFRSAWTEPGIPPDFYLCQGVDVPATSVWGLVIMTMLGMVAGTLVLRPSPMTVA
jgi:hypothetical protein